MLLPLCPWSVDLMILRFLSLLVKHDLLGVLPVVWCKILQILIWFDLAPAEKCATHPAKLDSWGYSWPPLHRSIGNPICPSLFYVHVTILDVRWSCQKWLSRDFRWMSYFLRVVLIYGHSPCCYLEIRSLSILSLCDPCSINLSSIFGSPHHQVHEMRGSYPHPGLKINP